MPVRKKKKTPAAKKKKAAPKKTRKKASRPRATAAAALEAVAPAPLGEAVGVPFIPPVPLAGPPVALPPVDPGPAPAGVEVLNGFAWENYPQNLKQTTGTMYRLSNGPGNDPNVAVKAIQWAVRDVAAKGLSLTGSGSRWSFSPVAQNPNAQIDIRAMANQLTFRPDELANPAEATRLIQVQGGTTVQQLLRYAETAGQDLIAMGGNCGQTIAGAISTGTHGGFIDRPGFPEMVRALYVIGEGGTRYWLERASKPVLSASLASTYQAAGVVVRRDDAFFNHAVVALGAFGVIYAVVLDTMAAYSVTVSRKKVDFDDAIDAATFDRNFASFGAPPPIDFATVVNPFRMSLQNGKWRGQGAAVRTVLTLAPPTIPPPAGGTGSTISDQNLGPLLAGFAAAVPGAVTPLMDVLMGALYGDRLQAGPMSIAYPLSLTRAPSLGMELGVPGNRAREVFGIILSYLQSAPRALPGPVAIRQTLQSQATLSMARFAPTTAFEFACLGVPGTEELLTGLLDRLEAQTIPFTIHLGMLHGKQADGTSWLTRARFERMYGVDAVNAWRAARAVTAPVGNLFSTAVTRAWGLTS